MDPATLEAPTEPKRRSRTRSALIEATKRLLSKSSIGGFTIDDVVREADVARGTFYNHFPGVDALVTHTLAEVQDDLYTCITAAAADSPDGAAQLVRGIATVMRYGYANQANSRVLMYLGPGVADPHGHGNRVLLPALQRGLSEGVIKVPSLDVAVVTVLGICEVGLARMIDIHHEYSAVRELTSGMCTVVLRALGADSRRIDKLVREAMLLCFDAPLGR